MLVGCGGGGAASGDGDSAAAGTEAQASGDESSTDGKDKIGAFISAAKDGALDMSYAGMKVTLPDELKDANIAGIGLVETTTS